MPGLQILPLNESHADALVHEHGDNPQIDPNEGNQAKCRRLQQPGERRENNE